jgi:ABC-type transport system involved in multi-copper enzyme maturation permease subunit
MSIRLMQTGAMLVDAYRELNSKRLFWITMVLSALVVAVFGMFGINERGLTFLHWEWPLPLFNSKTIPPSLFYRFAFVNIGVPIWLTWIATSLALISTASIIPDFVAGGSIELTLSRPISRLRLFLTKFFTGLLFVALQVAVFTLACFLVIAIRGGEIEWGIWMAVPIVVLFFSYLFSICALVGLITRSTIASLLVTLLCWVACFAVNVTDAVFIQQRAQAEISVLDNEKLVARRETQTRRVLRDAVERNQPFPVAKEGEDQLEVINPVLKFTRKELVESRIALADWEYWTSIGVAVKTFLPKTSETIGLLNRGLVSMEELRKLGLIEDETVETDIPDDPTITLDPKPDAKADGKPEAKQEPARRRRRGGPDPRATRIVEEHMRNRTTLWIIGTSLAFEAVILGIACVIFVRRDF